MRTAIMGSSAVVTIFSDHLKTIDVGAEEKILYLIILSSYFLNSVAQSVTCTPLMSYRPRHELASYILLRPLGRLYNTIAAFGFGGVKRLVCAVE